MTKEEAKKLFEESKMNAELIIRPLEKLIPLYKFCIGVLIIYSLTVTGLFGYYIHRSMNNDRLATRAFVTSLNKTIERCTDVKRSNVRMD